MDLWGARPSNEDVVLVHVAVAQALKDAVRLVLSAAVRRRESALSGQIEARGRRASEEARAAAELRRNGAEDEDAELDDGCTEVRGLVEVLELGLFHGLKAKKGQPANEVNFWAMVLALEKVSEQSFGPSRMLAEMNSKSKTERGKCKAWIRQLLNQNALEFTLRAFCKLMGTVGTKIYEEWAFLRWSNEPNRSMYFNLLSSLNGIGFHLDITKAFDGPGHGSLGPVLDSKMLSVSSVIEVGMLNSRASGRPAEPSILVISTEDIECSGRYVHVEKGIFGNRVTGYQIIFGPCPWNGLSGWALYDPSGSSSTPLYFVASTAGDYPPLVGWRIAVRPGVFKPPSMLRMKYAFGLSTVLDSTIDISKESLLRDEIQALRVEIKQIETSKLNLDELRKMDILAFAESRGIALPSPPEIERSGVSHDVNLESVANEQSVTVDEESSQDLEDDEAVIHTTADDISDEIENVSGCDEDMSEPTCREPDGTNTATEEQIDTSQGFEETEQHFDGTCQDDKYLMSQGLTQAKGAEEVEDLELVKENKIEGSMSGLGIGSPSFELETRQNNDEMSPQTPTEVLQPSKLDADSEENSTVETIALVQDVKQVHNSQVSERVAENHNLTTQNTTNEAESPHNADVESMLDLERTSSGDQETYIAEPNSSRSSGSASETQEKSKRRAKSKTVKVVNFDENMESSWGGKQSVRVQHGNSSSRAKVRTSTSVVKAKVFDDPKPVKHDAGVLHYALDADAALNSSLDASQVVEEEQVSLTSGLSAFWYPKRQSSKLENCNMNGTTQEEINSQDETETEEERMERYAREEEESLAAYVAEMENEKQAKIDDDTSRVSDEHTFYTPPSTPSPKKKRSPDGSFYSGEDEESRLLTMVRKYAAMDPETEDAAELALEIFNESEYVVGPLAAISRGTRQSSFFDRHIQSWEHSGSSIPLTADSSSEKRTSSDSFAGIIDNEEENDESVSMQQADPFDVEQGVILHAQVVGQHIKRGPGAHVRFVIRVKYSNSGIKSPMLTQNAAVLDDEEEAGENNEQHHRNLVGTGDLLSQFSITVQRRFSDFKKLAQNLHKSLGNDVEFPPLPKTAWIRNFSEDYILKKRLALDDFLQEILRMAPFGVPIAQHPILVAFLIEDPKVHILPTLGKKVPKTSGGVHVSLITEPRPETYKLEEKDSEGLAEQDFKCTSCCGDISIALGNSLSIFRSNREKAKQSARFCHYLERWFCPSCFILGCSAADAKNTSDASSSSSASAENEEGDIEPDEFLRMLPTRILHHWDFALYPVSHTAAVFLDNIFDHPILCISASNPKLFSTIRMLQHARLLRLQLVYAKELVESCPRWSLRSNMLGSAFAGREYLAKETELYSIRDLLEMHQGILIPALMRVVERVAEHITEDCDFCRSKGYICEICNDSKILYSFQIMTVVECRKCSGFFHRKCFAARGGEENCLRCQRKRR